MIPRNSGTDKNNQFSAFFPKTLTANAKTLETWGDVVSNVMSSRSDLWNRMLDPRRDIADECGYPKGVVSAWDYYQLFEEEPIPARVVECFPVETWQVSPEVYESEDSTSPTPFEEAFDEIGDQLRGEQSFYKDEENTSNPLWEYLARLDKMAGIGSYGVMLIGVDDGLRLDEPVAGWVEEGTVPIDYPRESQVPGAGLAPGSSEIRDQKEKDEEQRLGTIVAANRRAVNTPTPSHLVLDKYPAYNLTINFKETKGRKLRYLRIFPEHLAQITQFESNPDSPRFGQPTMYLLTFNDPRDGAISAIGLTTATMNVHWTRVIHVADNLTSSEVFGTPRMRPVLRRLLDLQKLYGGSAEMYWRGAFPGLSFETHPQLGGDVDIDRDSLKDEYEQYTNGLQRALFLMGMSAKTLSPAITDPRSYIDIAIEAICIRLAIPKRIFMGSERGELASGQDDGTWNDRIRGRQRNFASPRIVIPTIDRFIAMGVLPKPTYTPPPETALGTPIGPEGANGLPLEEGGKPNIDPISGKPTSPLNDPDNVYPPNEQETKPGFEPTEEKIPGPKKNPRFGKTPVNGKGKPVPNFSRNAGIPFEENGPRKPPRTPLDARGEKEGEIDPRSPKALLEKQGANGEGNPFEGSNGNDRPTLPPSEKNPYGLEPNPLKPIKTKMGYCVFWPDIQIASDAQKAQVASTKTGAMAAYISGGVNALVPESEYLTRFMGFTEEEASMMVEQAKAAAEEQEILDMEKQAQAIEQGLAPDMADPKTLEAMAPKGGGGPPGFPPGGGGGGKGFPPKPGGGKGLPFGKGAPGGPKDKAPPFIKNERWERVENNRDYGPKALRAEAELKLYGRNPESQEEAVQISNKVAQASWSLMEELKKDCPSSKRLQTELKTLNQLVENLYTPDSENPVPDLRKTHSEVRNWSERQIKRHTRGLRIGYNVTENRRVLETLNYLRGLHGNAAEMLMNANPEGCNQYTGPNCTGEAKEASHYSNEASDESYKSTMSWVREARKDPKSFSSGKVVMGQKRVSRALSKLHYHTNLAKVAAHLGNSALKQFQEQKGRMGGKDSLAGTQMFQESLQYHKESKKAHEDAIRILEELEPALDKAPIRKLINLHKEGVALHHDAAEMLTGNAEGENCGTGAGGFQPGNTCGGRGNALTPARREAAEGAEHATTSVKTQVKGLLDKYGRVFAASWKEELTGYLEDLDVSTEVERNEGKFRQLNIDAKRGETILEGLHEKMGRVGMAGARKGKIQNEVLKVIESVREMRDVTHDAAEDFVGNAEEISRELRQFRSYLGVKG